MKDIDNKIAKLQEEIAKLEKEKKIYTSLTPAQRVAEILHKKMCRYNHTDGCGWHYEKWGDDYTKYSDRKEYFDKANALLKKFTEQQIEEFIELL